LGWSRSRWEIEARHGISLGAQKIDAAGPAPEKPKTAAGGLMRQAETVAAAFANATFVVAISANLS
jgi:hypothetical protein